MVELKSIMHNAMWLLQALQSYLTSRCSQLQWSWQGIRLCPSSLSLCKVSTQHFSLSTCGHFCKAYSMS